jgi:hypothetical protein
MTDRRDPWHYDRNRQVSDPSGNPGECHDTSARHTPIKGKKMYGGGFQQSNNSTIYFVLKQSNLYNLNTGTAETHERNHDNRDSIPSPVHNHHLLSWYAVTRSRQILSAAQQKRT